MNKIRNAFAAVIVLCAAQTTLGQSADWVSLFRELVSPDPSVSQAARMRSFTELILELETKEAKAIEPDINAIPRAFDEEEPIRFQASVLLAGLAIRRSDSAMALQPAIPRLLSNFRDTDPAVRRNAVMAIVNLRPTIPQAALGLLPGLALDRDQEAAREAIYGLARFARASREAVDALKNLLASNQPTYIRRAVVQSVGNTKVQAPEMIAALTEALQDGDRELVLDTVRAAMQTGFAAKPMKPQLARLMQGPDKEVASAGASVIARLP